MSIRRTRWMFACAFVVLGTALANADEGAWKSILTGKWNSARTGDNLLIARAQIGWEAWLSSVGQGTISDDAQKGANLLISSAKGNCDYYITVVTNNTLSLQLRDGDKDVCVDGRFNKVEAKIPTYEHHPVVVKKVVVVKREHHYEHKPVYTHPHVHKHSHGYKRVAERY